MSAPAVETRDLTRIYKGQFGRPDVVALDHFDLQIEPGEVRGLLGPNGAGKTTLVRILCTVLTPTSGSASVLGHDVVRDLKAVRRTIGIVFGGERGVYYSLTARQNLEYWAALYAVPPRETRARIDMLLDRVNLLSRADDLVETFSRGMKQRLHLARGLLGDPRVIFLDEPTSGMDPVAAHDFRSLIKALQSEGRTILVTTHDMAEAEAICDRVTLIDHGRILAVETPRTLAGLLTQHERLDFESDREGLIASVRAMSGVESVTALEDAGMHRVQFSRADALREVLRHLVDAGVTVVRTSRPSLEEVYFRYIGRREGEPR